MRLKRYWITMFSGVLLLACGVVPLGAATLVWDPNTDTVDGYRIYYGLSASDPSNTIDVGNTTQFSLDSISLYEDTQYFFSVSAYNSAGESDRSAAVGFTPQDQTPPLPPKAIVLELQ
jgi:hypothetical protein